MRHEKSLKKEYHHDRRYDFDEYYSMKGKRFTKKRSHKRARKQLDRKDCDDL